MSSRGGVATERTAISVLLYVLSLGCRLVSRSTGDAQHRFDIAARFASADRHLHVHPHRQQKLDDYRSRMLLLPVW